MDFPLIDRVNAAQKCADAFMFEPFVWGRADCAHLASLALTELNHPDPLKGFRRYSTEAGAKRALLKAGFATIEDVLDQKVGLTRIPPASALPGDIVAIPGGDNAEWSALGVVLDQDRVIAFADLGSGPRGEMGSLIAATTAWRSI